ncbi:MAG: carbohydrate kinase, partial [Pseudomonadota bacterium]
MTLSLGIDLGTSGVRTAVLDENLHTVSMARVGHLAQDASNIDAEKWWQAVQNCVIQQTGKLREQGLDPA